MCIHLKLALLSYYQEYVLLLPEYLYHLCIPKYHLYMYYTNVINIFYRNIITLIKLLI